ncbi:related to enoyl-coa hydratase protein 3 [Melanopsichium pennsylvanicum]|uniref:Related to enoyl-coa hydratase protein 3 n=2 Tax=Melanopsichium pennsylvanicum TaxID=63383 RepID=A0AAJ4XTX6_9BASI|nr:related to enoyl-coa hydratase protein 3 [Melanopsichium pennsylvanicum 4]SNX88062.1 related to enoyl-coa hydratase protein 3 [Melanopsichium pennsylvanicum]
MLLPTPTQTLAGGKVKLYHVNLQPFDDPMSPRLPFSSNAKAMICYIDRPSVKNAIDRQTATALHSAFVSFAHDPSLRVAILTGANGTFCAGADLKSIFESSLLGSPQSEVQSNSLDPNMDAIAPMGVTRLAMNKPVIAAVEGYAVAGGLELALWADLRVACSEAVFGILCRLRGVPLIDGGTVRLPALIGGSRASDLALTGRLVGAQEAESIGLVNYIVPKSNGRMISENGFGAVVDKAVRIAAGLAANPQSCMLNDRESMHNAIYSSVNGGDEVESEKEEKEEKVDLRLRGGLRKAMEKEFELGMQSLAKLLEEGQVEAFVNRSQKQREVDRAKSRTSNL